MTRVLETRSPVMPRILTASLLALLVVPYLGADAAAQSILRGSVDQDPLVRVGRTALDEAPQTRGSQRRPEAAPARPRRSGPVRGQGTAPGKPERATVPEGQLAGTTPQFVAPRRPRQQSNRSLERPVNTAVLAPNGEQVVHQGLPEPQIRRNRSSVTDPYAPLGLRLGNVLVFPTVDAQVGYDDNPERRTTGSRKKGSTFVRTEAGFTARSDWSEHQLQAELRGGYSKYFATPNADRPDGQARIGLRLDASRDTAFDAELRGRIETQVPGSANLTAAATGRPFVYQTGGSLGVTQRFNRLAVSLRGSIDRSDYADAKLTDGQTLSQKDRNFTQYGVRLRTAYEVSPALTPFAEVGVDTRSYDQKIDSTGVRRDSTGVQVKAGSRVEITRTLTGEVAAGYGLRRYEDQNLGELRGPIVEAALNWSVTPLTTFRARASTTFEETTQTGSSGSVVREAGVEVSHALLRNLTLTGGVSFAWADFQGINRRDDTLRAGLGAEYSINRNMVLRASYNHERVTSNTPNNGLSSNIFLFGARLQY
jgi:hypothetical protein